MVDSDGTGRLRAWREDPRYWAYGDDPTLLVGASSEDNRFQLPDLEDELDALAAAGGNYVRNTMSSREEFAAWPFAEIEGGVYDLEAPNDEYWERLDRFLELTAERGIVPQFELWAFHDFVRQDNWGENPWNPANTVSYDTADVTLPETVEGDYHGDERHPFFLTVPGANDDAAVREYVTDAPRPITHVKTYGGRTHWTDGPERGLKRFWRNLLGGAASTRLHRPPAGVGLNDRARRHVASARALADRVPLVRARVDADHDLLLDRGPDEAYLTRVPGEQYAVYFPDGGSVGVDLSGAAGTFDVEWLHVEGATWRTVDPRTVAGGGTVRVEAPHGGHWVAVLTARSGDGDESG